jgi:hypothetical protein
MRIPSWLTPVITVALVGWILFQLFTFGRAVERKACDLERTEFARQITTQDLGTSEGRRAEEGATTNARTTASDDYDQAIQTLVGQRDAAAAAAVGLRQQLAQAIDRAKRGTPGNPATEQSSQAVEAIGAIFAACEARHRELAAAADAHLAAGQRCEAEYDALSAVPAPASGVGE